MAAEVRNLEGEKADLSVEAAFLKSKLKEAVDEAGARTDEADALRLRIAKATQVCSCGRRSMRTAIAEHMRMDAGAPVLSSRGNKGRRYG
jgi:hypothetical protein